MEFDFVFVLVPYLDEVMQIMLKKATFSTVPMNELPTPVRRKMAATQGQGVQKPGSRGATRWYYDKNHQVVYGDPPQGHTGMHSGDFHQMFVQHAPTSMARGMLTHHVPQEAQRHQFNEKQLIMRGMDVAHGHHDAHLEELRDDLLSDPENPQLRAKYEKAIEKMGKNLEAIHAGIQKHGLDKDKDVSTQYMRARRNHAQRLVDIEKLNVTLPTDEELKAWPFPKTHQDIINMANTYLPHTHFDIEDMDLETADALVYQFLFLAKDHPPEMFRSLEHFGTRSESSNVPVDWEDDHYKNEFAHMTRDNTVMAINPRYAKDIAEFRQEVAYSFKHGWFVSGEVKDIVTHEFGHMVDNYYSNDPRTAALMLEWKVAHARNLSKSGYARYDDDRIETANYNHDPNPPPIYERREQWAESHVAITVTKDHEKLDAYSLHQRRLLDFFRDNPDFDVEKYPFAKHELEHLGIKGEPQFVYLEGENYE